MKRVVNALLWIVILAAVSVPLWRGVVFVFQLGRDLSRANDIVSVFLSLLLALLVLTPLVMLVLVGVGIAVSVLGGRGPYLLIKKFERGSLLLLGREVQRYVPVDEYHWRWSLPARRLRACPLVGETTFSFTVRPITAHSRVREIFGYITVRPGIEDLSALQRLVERGCNETWPAQVRLEVFDLACSRADDLSEFSNPLRLEQQAEFEKLVQDALGKKLSASGLRVASCQFSLN